MDPPSGRAHAYTYKALGSILSTEERTEIYRWQKRKRKLCGKLTHVICHQQIKNQMGPLDIHYGSLTPRTLAASNAFRDTEDQEL